VGGGGGGRLTSRSTTTLVNPKLRVFEGGGQAQKRLETHSVRTWGTQNDCKTKKKRKKMCPSGYGDVNRDRRERFNVVRLGARRLARRMGGGKMVS